jgi:hypothetical protein
LLGVEKTVVESVEFEEVTIETAAASWSRTCGRRGQREADAACAVEVWPL